MQSAEASGSSVKPVADLSSMPVVRGALSSDFAYFPVGHQDPDGLLGNYEDVQMGKSSGGIAPIDVLQLGGRKNAGGKVQPRDVHLRLLFGACGDPRHVIESFYELESQLTGRPVLPTPPKKSKKKEGGSSGSASNKQWGWVSLTCDMNDFDARVLARNVLFLVMLREAGDRMSQEGGRVLDKTRWQIRAAEAKSMPEIVEVQKQWKELHLGLDDRVRHSSHLKVGACCGLDVEDSLVRVGLRCKLCDFEQFGGKKGDCTLWALILDIPSKFEARSSKFPLQEPAILFVRVKACNPLQTDQSRKSFLHIYPQREHQHL
jgi:hypothetical protein